MVASRLLFLVFMALTVALHSAACSYPKEKFREFQKEIVRRANEPRTPEERCQRQGGVMNGEQCYTPSPTALDERACRLRGGMYLNDQCLVSPRGEASITVTP